MPFSLVQGPSEHPITLAEAKLHCRVTESGDDDWFNNICIPTVVNFVQNKTGRSLMTQQWDLSIDEFPIGPIRLGKPPIQAVASVKYIRSDGVLVTMSGADYFLDAATLPGWIHPVYGTDWPNDVREIGNAVTVRFTTGYANAAAVPSELKLYMLCAIGEFYNNREMDGATMERMKFVEHLIDGLVVPRV